MYEAPILYTGCIAALVNLFILGRAPPDRDLINWMQDQPFLTSLTGFLTGTIAISFTSLGFAGLYDPLPLTSLRELLFASVWALVIGLVGYLALYGARSLYQENTREQDTSDSVTRTETASTNEIA